MTENNNDIITLKRVFRSAAKYGFTIILAWVIATNLGEIIGLPDPSKDTLNN